jgi:hypothetical protein
MQNLQIVFKNSNQGCTEEVAFPPPDPQTKTGLPPAVQMLYWLLPSPRKRKATG